MLHTDTKRAKPAQPDVKAKSPDASNSADVKAEPKPSGPDVAEAGNLELKPAFE